MLRKKANQSMVRTFKIPKLNFEAKEYTEIIHWPSCEVTEPPVISSTSNEELQKIIETGEYIKIPKFPCHTQAVERNIKLVTESSTAVCGQSRRDGYIRAKIQSQQLMPSFETKSDYNFF